MVNLYGNYGIIIVLHERSLKKALNPIQQDSANNIREVSCLKNLWREELLEFSLWHNCYQSCRIIQEHRITSCILDERED